MCEMAEVEFDGDPESMTLKDKSKLLKRLSKNPQTEQYFRNERALSEFIETKLQITIPELERKTHLGIFRDKSGVGRSTQGCSKSRMSLGAGIDSRISNVHNKTLSKVSLTQQHSRVSNTVPNSPSQQIFISRGLSQISNHSLTSHGSHLMGQKTKRKSTTYDIASEIIKKDHRSGSTGKKDSRKDSNSFLKNIFNTSNSIYTEKHDKKFRSQNIKHKKY